MARRRQPFFKKSRGVGYVQLNGRQINLGPDEEKAWERFYELMSKKPEEQRISSRSIVAIIEAFLEWVHHRRSPETYEWYQYRLERFANRFPDLSATDLKPYHVETWVDSYELATTSQRNFIRAVKCCLRWALRHGYVERNPIAYLTAPSAEAREIVYSQEEFDQLLSSVQNDDLIDLLHVTWETGCRPQESLRVEARHVDLKNQRWVIPKSESKTKRMVRIVYLTDRAFAITRRRMLTYPDGPIFRNSHRQPWRTDAVNCGIRTARIRIGKALMKERGEKVSDEDIAARIKSLNWMARAF
jgi:integrase